MCIGGGGGGGVGRDYSSQFLVGVFDLLFELNLCDFPTGIFRFIKSLKPASPFPSKNTMAKSYIV